MKKIFSIFVVLILLFSYKPVFAVEYLPINYNTVSYKQSNGKSVNCNYALISSSYKPRLAVANDYSKDFLYSLTSSLEADQMETPVSMASRLDATLLTNLGRGGYRQPLVVDGERMTKLELDINADVVYMTNDGLIHTMDVSKTTYQDLMDENPNWADYIFYKIVENNTYIDPSNRGSYDYISLRHPRTFLGQTSTGDYIIGVCDGRNDGITSDVKDDGTIVESEYGLKLNEIYDFVKKNITTDVRILVNADGGGSCSFVYKGERKNRMFGTSERTRLTGLYWAPIEEDEEEEEEYYYVKFDSNGGTGKMNNQKIKVGDSQALSENSYTKHTYNFNSWNTKKDGTGTSYKNKTNVKDLTTKDKTITLYAQWKKAEIIKIEVTNKNDIEVLVGSNNINLEKINLQISYNNGDTETGNAKELGASVTGFDSSKPGENEITLSIEGKTTTYTLKVVNDISEEIIVIPDTFAGRSITSIIIGALLIGIGVIIIKKTTSKKGYDNA